jgi:hypothetical protein
MQSTDMYNFKSRKTQNSKFLWENKIYLSFSLSLFLSFSLSLFLSFSLSLFLSFSLSLDYSKVFAKTTFLTVILFKLLLKTFFRIFFKNVQNLKASYPEKEKLLKIFNLI